MDLRLLLFFGPLIHFSTYGRTPWTSDQLVARPLPTQDNTTKTDEDKHPCLKWYSNPWSSVRALKARASDRAATGSALYSKLISQNFCKSVNILNFQKTYLIKEYFICVICEAATCGDVYLPLMLKWWSVIKFEKYWLWLCLHSYK
jgi:hypothetical protein